MDWIQNWKGAHQDCISSPCLFNLYAEYIMRNAGLNYKHNKTDTEKKQVVAKGEAGGDVRNR